MSQQLRVDKSIINVNENIVSNIKLLSQTDPGLLSQNILSDLRYLVEYVAIKEYAGDNDLDPDDQRVNKEAVKHIKQRGELNFLSKFHKLLQISTSHYKTDKDASERLMLKYYEHLLKLKKYLKDTYGMEVLENISVFAPSTDQDLFEYYEKIVERIKSPSSYSSTLSYNDRCYIQKIKPFFIGGEIYYEVTFTAAFGNVSKFNRTTAFTKLDIMDNYAVEFSLRSDRINILGQETPILIIDKYKVSIRECEWNNFSKILYGEDYPKINPRSKECVNLMSILAHNQMSLTELVSSEQDYYDRIKAQVTHGLQSVKIFKLLDLCREYILDEKPGVNVLRYLLHKMNNRVIKGQYSDYPCESLSNLFLENGSIPFDKMPYCTSLLNHNPRIYDLFQAIPVEGREHELFARFITNNTEVEGKLFTPRVEIEDIDNIDALIDRYNNSLYLPRHDARKLEIFKHHIYIAGYVDNTTEIIKRLQELSSNGVSQYMASVDSWLSNGSYIIDDEKKQEALHNMFVSSHVAIIYGSAGTGKSTLIQHIASFWANKEKIFLANTHSAVDNMRRKVSAENSKYRTIANFLSNGNNETNCDILFIDECSTVSNNDMRCVLDKANFQLLVLVGDTFQIESINFGNWFSIARHFIPETSIFELTHPYRTNNEKLIDIWNSIRNLDDAILERLVKNHCIGRLDESIFDSESEDEIILCLNYDGLYGINNINRFLQNSNPEEGVEWGVNLYKVGDPILFNDANKFSPLIPNNTKGKIVDIKLVERQIYFVVELDKSINEVESSGYDFELIGVSEEGNSIISFYINKYRSTDEDDDSDSTAVPFQVAYAISIHKAQGLEYDSVKIIITDEIEEQITHNIFYTAITRTKDKLKIYWSPGTEQKILTNFNNLKGRDPMKDVNLLKELSSL